MILKGLIDEDFIQYKKCSMTLMFPDCSFKCDKECGEQVCQNSALVTSSNIECDVSDIIERYVSNDISEAVVIGGLEPLDTTEQLFEFIKLFRKQSNDDIVVYTGYYESEKKYTSFLKYIKENNYKNVIAKVGRFVPNKPHVFDELLGVELASDNQYGVRIS